MDVLEPGETPLDVVRRHPIGIVGLYLEALVAIAAVLLLIFFIAPDILTDLSKQSNRFILAGVVLAITILIFVLLVATYAYSQSRLLITDRNLIQIAQKALFGRTITRVSIASVEEVDVSQNGILATIFNYGNLQIQTAGARPNFLFKTTPDPNRYANRINAARQAYAESLKEQP
jgi:membrane protein YdbS with pleckstrin-like domain